MSLTPSVDLVRPSFTLRLFADHFQVLLNGVGYFDLSVRSSVDADGGPADLDGEILAPTQGEADYGPWFEWRTRSNLWEEKLYRLEVYPDAWAYRVTVRGEGRIGKIAYFSGGGTPETRGSQYEVGQYLVPAPGGGEHTLPEYHSIAQDGRISLHYLCPPLLAFPFGLGDRREPWLALGLAPRPGHYNLDHFAYHWQHVGGGRTRCYLATDYLGYTQVHGEYEVAAIVGTAGADEFAALENHAQWLYDYGGCVRRDWSDAPRWWYGPLFCGWGEQCAIRPDRPVDAANQVAYQGMSDQLDAHGLEPTAIIIDDKWMATYGEALPDPAKWPDLRGFVETQHARGRRVLLWFKAWNTEGLPGEECINLWSQPCGADPNAPAYRRRLQKMMQRLLGSGPEDYNCDGFKVDFANVMPLGRDLRGTTEAYGIELLKQWFVLFYQAAKAVKPDCLINCSSAHPYFAEVTDQCRLHDYFWGQRSAWQVMSYRQRLFRAAFPGVLIDTDGVVSTHRETMDYARRCAELGVPDLYVLTGGGDTELTAADLAEIAQVWRQYKRRLDAGSSESP